MESQTELSLSPQPTNSGPLENSLSLDSSPYPVDPESPDPSPLPESPEADQALAAAPEGSTPTPSSEKDYTQEVPSWGSLDEVNVEAVPAAARPYVEHLLGLARVQEARQHEALTAYQQSKAHFDALVEQMESAGVEDARPMAQQLTAQTELLSTYAQQVASSAWMAFEARNPHYAKLPPQTKDAFAKVLENPSFDQTWEGKTYVEKMEDALRFAQYRTNVQVAPTAATVSPSAAALPPIQTTPRDTGVARRQAAVATGETGGGLPVRAIDELSWDEVLGRHDHLLR